MKHVSYAAALAALSLGASTLIVVTNSVVYAQDNTVTKLPETVVTADRIEVPREEVGRDIDVRTSDDFHEQESSSLNDSLQTIAGIRSQNLGGPGSPGTTPIEIRGFGTAGTQLLLNGMRLNDPSSISGIADTYFAFQTNNDLRSIEVLKGANGTLYGSDGQAGSINLLTQKPVNGVSAELATRDGSFGSYEEIVQLNAATEQGGLLTTVTQQNSDGLHRRGNFDNTTLTSAGEYKLDEQITFSPIFRMIASKNDLDTSPTVGADGGLITNQPSDANTASAQGYFYGLVTDYKPCEGVSSKLSLYANSTVRNYFYDFGGGFASSSEFKGDSYNVDWQNSVEVPDLYSTVIGGLEYEHQDYESLDGTPDSDSGGQDRYALFLKDRLAFLEKSLVFDGGMRLTHVSAVDRTLSTFEISGLYKIPEVESRLHSSFSQGFRAPSLYELRGKSIDETTGAVDTVGNRSLKPEETMSFDVGVTQPLYEKKLEADVTFFNLSSSNTIFYDATTNSYINNGGGETQGLEYSLTATPTDWWKLRGAYTYLGEANVGGERVQRHPYNVFSAASSATLGIVTWYTELRYRGSEDLEFFGVDAPFKEGQYTVLDTALTIPVVDNWEVFVRGDNLFDAHYTDSGYRMPGISFFGGIRVKFGV